MQSSDPLPCSFVLKNTAHLLKKKRKNGDHSQGPFFLIQRDAHSPANVIPSAFMEGESLCTLQQ